MNKDNTKPKSIFFVTLGCRLNQAETEKIKQEALANGFGLASNEEAADIFVLNSCSVTDKAQRDTEKLLRKLYEKYPKAKLVITGCSAREAYSKFALIVKNENKSELFRTILQNIPRFQYKTTPGVVSATNIGKVGQRTRLMYKIQEGCNNFCTYCIVPYLRGREKSIDSDQIIVDLKQAEVAGYKEVVLCGINIGKYQHQLLISGVGMDLAGLIRQILAETRLPRIRISSINPEDVSDDLIKLMAEEKRVCNHLHISLQSGSDTVLKRMGRRYDTKKYSELLTKLRKQIKDITITTDIIVGFPGETEEEFAETIKFVKKMKFLKVHVFRYSPREGTRAAKMQDQISEKIKKERAVKLQELESKIRQKTLLNYISEGVEVLFEQEKPKGTYSGFTANYLKVLKKSDDDLTNKIKKIRIKEIRENGLLAN